MPQHTDKLETPEVSPSQIKPRALSQASIILLGGVASTLGTLLISNDACCTAFSALFVCAIVVGLLDLTLDRMVFRGVGWSSKARIIVVLLTAFVVSLCFRLDPSTAFKRAFGVLPPAGVRNLVAEAHYVGGPGDRVVLLEFESSREILERILAHRPFRRDAEIVDWLQTGEIDWHYLLTQLFGGALPFNVGSPWNKIAPMARPEVYRWDEGSGSAERTTVLWDAASEKAYVLYSLG